MLLQEYQMRYDTRPESNLEAYCRLEGMDPREVIGAVKKDRAHKTAGPARKTTGHLKSLFEAARPERAQKLGTNPGRI